MFYAQFVLAKKGPLAKIWLAAHWEKKLTKAQIFETDVPQAVEEMMKPKVKMALRTIGHLLLGIVRIYSKKTRYLLADTNEAFLRMRMNFRFGMNLELNDVAEEGTDNVEIFDENDVVIPEFLEAEAEFDLLVNQGRLEDITLKENVDFFGDLGRKNVYNFLESDDFGDNLYESLPTSSMASSGMMTPIEVGRRNGTELSANLDFVNQINEQREKGESIVLQDIYHEDAMDFQMDFGGNTPRPDLFDSIVEVNRDATAVSNIEHPAIQDPSVEKELEDVVQQGKDNPASFALEPLDVTIVAGKGKRQQKKRKLVIDEALSIPPDDLQKHMEDFGDLIVPISTAPPTRKLLEMSKTGELNYIMGMPAMHIGNKDLLAHYSTLFVPFEFQDPESENRPSPLEGLVMSEEYDVDHDGYSAEFSMGRPDSRLDQLVDMDFDIEMADAMNAGDGGYMVPANEISDLPINKTKNSSIGFGAIYNDENKENEQDYDPFASRAGSVRSGRLEDYGFGSKKADESKWAKRTNAMLEKINDGIQADGKVLFSTIVAGAATRKSAAEHFYALLTLAKSQAIVADQKEPFGEITITAGRTFAEMSSENMDTTLTTSSSFSAVRSPLSSLVN